MLLHPLTVAINFLGLVAAIWLGIYVITRSARSLITWLTGLALWLLAGLFLNVLLALYPPPVFVELPDWFRLFLPFWPSEALEGSSNGWLQGWSVAPAIALWHHVTTLMRPGGMNPWRWTRVLAGYTVGVLAIFLQAYTPFLFAVEGQDPLYLNTIRAGSWYSFFFVAMLVVTWGSFVNLARSARAASTPIVRQQLLTLVAANFVAGLIGPAAIAGPVFGLPVPMLAVSLPLVIAVGLIGYGVARYSALMEGRTIRRDFLYNLVALVVVSLIYMGATGLVVLAYNVPPVVFIMIVPLAIITHSLTNLTQHSLDVVFYRQSTRQLRSNLRKLARLAGEQETLSEMLDQALKSLCISIRATYGLILLFSGDKSQQSAAYRWSGGTIDLSPAELLADDFIHLSTEQLPPPLMDAALLYPFHGDDGQFGALVLGRPVNGLRYSSDDLDHFLDPADRLADAIATTLRQGKHLEQISRLAVERQTHSRAVPEKFTVKVVENVLRNLYDYAHLADTPLAKSNLVAAHLPPDPYTHLDFGKAVHRIVVDALEKLNPGGEPSSDPPARKWYPYLILHDAYLEDHPNREIMSRLYISEGTFNRTRRAAIRAVTRALNEMETAPKLKEVIS